MSPGSAVTSLDYDVIDSPVGELLLVATDVGVVRLGFASEDFDAVLAALSARLGPSPRMTAGRLRPVAEQVTQYFAGQRRDFDVALDRSLSGTGFLADVQLLLSEIPYGATRTYRELAELSGRPGAVRAVGGACASNPIPILVPCHRVVRTDGALGGYRGGNEAKRILLDLEQLAQGH